MLTEVSEYFNIVKVDESENDYVLHLEEKNYPPKIESSDKLKSKGFYDVATVRDFPLRGNACYLRVKIRKWINMTTSEIVIRDWNGVAQTTRLTKEFAAFLKELIYNYPVNCSSLGQYYQLNGKRLQEHNM